MWRVVFVGLVVPRRWKVLAVKAKKKSAKKKAGKKRC